MLWEESLVILSSNLTKPLPAERLVADARSGIAILRLTAVTPWLPIEIQMN
jgi:hypothetical protein